MLDKDKVEQKQEGNSNQQANGDIINQTVNQYNYNISEQQIIEIYGNVIKDLTQQAKDELQEHAKAFAKKIIESVIKAKPESLSNLSKPKHQIIISDALKASLFSEREYDNYLVQIIMENIINDGKGEHLYINTKILAVLKVMPSRILNNFLLITPALYYQNYKDFKEFNSAINMLKSISATEKISVHDNTIAILEELSIIKLKYEDIMEFQSIKNNPLKNFYKYVYRKEKVRKYFLNIYFYFLAGKENNRKALDVEFVDEINQALYDFLESVIINNAFISAEYKLLEIPNYQQMADEIIDKDTFLNYDTDIYEIVEKYVEKDISDYVCEIIFFKLVWYTYQRIFGNDVKIKIPFILLLESLCSYRLTFLGEQLLDKINICCEQINN